MKKNIVRTASGFTLIELLVVIGIIAVLAAVVIVAINPSKQFAQARNAQRESNVATILNAIGQNIADNKGEFKCPGETISTSSSSPSIIGTSGADLAKSDCLGTIYIPSGIPKDPDGGTDVDTGYTVSVSSSGQYTVCAPSHAEPALASLGVGTYCLSR